MKYLNIFLMVAFILSACKKDAIEIKTTPIAGLNVANAVTGGGIAKLNTNLRDSVLLNNYKLFVIDAGVNTSIKMYPRDNPATAYYNQTAAIEEGGIYSLFLCGTSVSPDAVFVKDTIPAYSNDSIINVRIVNLSSNSTPLSVTLSAAPATAIFSSIAYKSITGFKSIPFKTSIPVGSNVFQLRNSAGTLLASYTLPAAGTVSIASSRFRNITLVIKGFVGTTAGTNAIGIYPMINY